jgi:hypothetical protein
MAAGDPVSSSDLTTIEDYTIRKPIVRLVQAAVQSLPHNTTTAITYAAGSEDIDTHGYHDVAVNNTRITPLIAGYYLVTVHTQMATASGTNYTQLFTGIGKNGTRFAPQQFIRPDAASNAGVTAQTTARVQMNGSTDYLEHFASQTNGASTAQNTAIAVGFQSTFEVEFVRPI